MKVRTKRMARDPFRLMNRRTAADLGLIKVVNMIGRATNGAVLGGRFGFICAAAKADRAPLHLLKTWESYGQVYDSVTTMKLY